MGMGLELLAQLAELVLKVHDLVLQPRDPALKVGPNCNGHGVGPEESKGVRAEFIVLKIDAILFVVITLREDVSLQLEHEVVGLASLDDAGEIYGPIAFFPFRNVASTLCNQQGGLNGGLRQGNAAQDSTVG